MPSNKEGRWIFTREEFFYYCMKNPQWDFPAKTILSIPFDAKCDHENVVSIVNAAVSPGIRLETVLCTGKLDKRLQGDTFHIRASGGIRFEFQSKYIECPASKFAEQLLEHGLLNFLLPQPQCVILTQLDKRAVDSIFAGGSLVLPVPDRFRLDVGDCLVARNETDPNKV